MCIADQKQVHENITLINIAAIVTVAAETAAAAAIAVAIPLPRKQSKRVNAKHHVNNVNKTNSKMNSKSHVSFYRSVTFWYSFFFCWRCVFVYKMCPSPATLTSIPARFDHTQWVLSARALFLPLTLFLYSDKPLIS